MSGVNKNTRDAVLERDGYRCQQCESVENLTLHHVKPLRSGGGNASGNLLTLCESCHSLWHRWEGNRVCFYFYHWLAGGPRRAAAAYRSRMVKAMTILRLPGR